MTLPALRFQQVDIRYGATAVLQGLNLQVEAGECLALVGLNGAGKTSLIKCLLDFIRPDSGRIEIFGQPHDQPASRSALGFLPESFIPPYYLKGAEFLRYVLSLQGLDYHAEQVHAMLAALDLAPAALEQTVRQYSKGMTQKLGLAACLLAPRALYVLDEPMSGLDPRAHALLRQQLTALRARGSTLFLTSHNLADVEMLCDRLAILHAGQIRFIGTPAQCRAQYGTATLEQAFLACIE
ncbi:ABC transporter ATP-binding protein [Pseudoduganella danionis]|uniref:ABC transporter ATP-binding protein n=1 Tax=Pseudoduganella danionis TaxID=1890295 RepID=UPI0035B03B9D